MENGRGDIEKGMDRERRYGEREGLGGKIWRKGEEILRKGGIGEEIWRKEGMGRGDMEKGRDRERRYGEREGLRRARKGKGGETETFCFERLLES